MQYFHCCICSSLKPVGALLVLGVTVRPGSEAFSDAE
jgi:hypothetical protein